MRADLKLLCVILIVSLSHSIIQSRSFPSLSVDADDVTVLDSDSNFSSDPKNVENVLDELFDSISVGGGGASTLQVKVDDVEITSPTASIRFEADHFNGLSDGTTAIITIDTQTLTTDLWIVNPVSATIRMNDNSITGANDIAGDDFAAVYGFTGSTISLTHTPTEADTHALEIITNVGGLGDINAIHMGYNAGAIVAGEDEAVIFVNIDRINTTGGEIFGYEMVATEGSAVADGMKVGVDINPVHQDSGSFINPTTGTDNTPSTDVANMIDGSSITLTNIFENDNEYILIGAAAAFQEIEIILDTGASVARIAPVFGYSTSGTHGFTTFSPIDGTNGFRQSGIISWDVSDLTGHTTNDDTGTFDIKITRTRNVLSITPILGFAKTAATTEYKWDKNGLLNLDKIILANGITASSATLVDLSVTYGIAAATGVFAGVIATGVGLDAIGAVDMDYGSGDVTDHTFLSDGTGTGEFVLKAGAIDGTEILDDTIDSDDYAAASIDNEHLADNAVDSDELAAGSVDVAHLAPATSGYVTNWDNAANVAITSAQITDGVVSLADMTAAATGYGTNWDNATNVSVTSAQILDATIVLGDLTDGTTGALTNYDNLANVPERSFAVAVSTPNALSTSVGYIIQPPRSYAVTYTTITVQITGGTSVVLMLQQRGEDALNSAGTDMWSGDVTATSGERRGGTVSDFTVPSNTAIVLEITSVTGAVDQLMAMGKHTED